jgi:uncharacterized protein YceH (UPF0502 family)
MFFLVQIGWSILLILFLQPHLSSAGEVYRWTDEKGTVHFTDDLSKIPKPYLDQVEKKRVPEETLEKREVPKEPSKKEEPLRHSEAAESPDRVKEHLKDIEEKIAAKKKIEKRIAQLEDELKQSEERLKKIEDRGKEKFPSYYVVYDSRRKKWVISSPEDEERSHLMKRMEDIKEELISLEEKLSKINRGL